MCEEVDFTFGIGVLWVFWLMRLEREDAKLRGTFSRATATFSPRDDSTPMTDSFPNLRKSYYRIAPTTMAFHEQFDCLSLSRTLRKVNFVP